MERDVIADAGLAGFAEVGLVIFVVVFFMIIARALLMKKKRAQQMANLPLDDGQDGPTKARHQEIEA